MWPMYLSMYIIVSVIRGRFLCFRGFPTKYGNVPDRALGFMNDLREAAKNGEVNDYLASIGQDEAEDIIESRSMPPEETNTHKHLFLAIFKNRCGMQFLWICFLNFCFVKI